MSFNDYIARKLTACEKLLLEAVQMTYRKHHLEDDRIGWDELGEQLLNALCEIMGDEDYQIWVSKMRFEIKHPIYKKTGREG